MADGGIAGVMADPLARLLAGLADPGRVGTILYLGAGEGQALDACLTSRAAHLCLVEPNPELAQELALRTADDPRVQVLPLAVAESDGRGVLRLFNMGPLSSLRAPADLAQLYPGLRERGRAEVATLSLTSLLARLPAPGPGADILVIDAPGEEEVVVNALLAGPGAGRFGQILMCCGTTPHYAGSAAIAALVPRLEAGGWWAIRTWDDDPDRPWELLVRDPGAVVPALLGPQGRTAQLQAEVAATTRAAAAQEAKARQQAEQAAAQIATLTTRLQEGEAARTAEAARLAAARAEAQKLQAEVAATTRAAAEQEAKARQQAEQAATQIATLTTRLQEGEAARTAEAARLAAARAEAQKLQTEVAALRETAARTAEQEAKARQQAEQAATQIATLTTRLQEGEAARTAEAARLAAARAEAQKLQAEVAAVQRDRAALQDQCLADAAAIRARDQRLAAAERELRRAEGQVALIRELLLREAGL